MKTNISLALNVVLAVAIIFLFNEIKKIDNNSQVNKEPVFKPVSTSASGPKIAYVNTDTLLLGYKLVSELNEEILAKKDISTRRLKSKEDALRNEIQSKTEEYKKSEADYFSKADKLSALMKQTREKELIDKQNNLIYFQQKAEQDLLQANEKYTNDLLNQELKNQARVFNNLQSVIHEYNAVRNYDLIMTYATGGALLYGNEAMNVTADILEMLNQQLAIEKQQQEQ